MKEVRGGRHQDHVAGARRAGLFKLAFVEDPWGTRIEVVQDPELLGLHHLHLRGRIPTRSSRGCSRSSAARRGQLKGRIDGVSYNADGFSSVWILVQKGESRAEHRPRDRSHRLALGRVLNDTIAELKARRGWTVTSEPRPLPLPNGPTINFSYVAGPAGARIELVERPGLKPGQ